MLTPNLINIQRVPDSLLSGLENRDAALWLRDVSYTPESLDVLVRFLRMPWKSITLETHDEGLLAALQSAETFSDPMIRKRGFIQVIDNDPSRLTLPQQCLPVYLLNGRSRQANDSAFESQLRRLTMIESLRRSAPENLVVLSWSTPPIPEALSDLWSSGFRSFLTIVSNAKDAEEEVKSFVQSRAGNVIASLLLSDPTPTILETSNRYYRIFPEASHVLRFREADGSLHQLDVVDLDEPERPLLASYELIEEKDLSPLLPSELSEAEFTNFFADSSQSWRPYAAELPWVKDSDVSTKLLSLLNRLDHQGAEETSIAYIAAEPGAGGTTLARALAWQCARLGYPTLLAKQIPFVPETLPVRNFLTKVNAAANKSAPTKSFSGGSPRGRDGSSRRYETPWLLVFDTIHWQNRDAELIKFRREMEKSGRPTCILVVSGSSLPLSFYTAPDLHKIGELNHAIGFDDAIRLGEHLNKFLKPFGKERKAQQWELFYREHNVRYMDGIAAFWVSLSFWIQGHYDLSESIQSWVYRSFKAASLERTLKEAVLRIAALSSERISLPETLLPTSTGPWPISHLLRDAQPSLTPIGLVRTSADGERYWGLVHDILGRFLINALFYDFAERNDLGFAHAQDPEHLRFLLLQKTAREPALGERAYRAIGEDFATSIFKIDPDHGHSNFVAIWPDVLQTLDSMPRTLRDTSRLFRHHSAISRRRITKLENLFYGPKDFEKKQLLHQAIDDIRYALDFIEYTPESEPSLNLLNSLANAYFDLADLEARDGASKERLRELRDLANDATRRAFAESPTNSFVVETYVKNLLQSGRTDPDRAVENSIEALGVLFSAMSTYEPDYRSLQLGSLADQALKMLLDHTSKDNGERQIRTAVDVLVLAWRALSFSGEMDAPSIAFDTIPKEKRELALSYLSNPAGRGNTQVLRLTYHLVCASRPFDFGAQLELVEQLVGTSLRSLPQLALEYAILLFQCGRALEGNKIYKDLRRLWRESESFVHVPDRLRWLVDTHSHNLKIVNAVISSDDGFNVIGRVQEFAAASAPLRPEEFSIRSVTPGLRVACHVSFGFKGPFLRPTTAGPAEVNQVRRD